MAKKRFYLYVWRNVLADYSSGIAFAVARSADEARRVATASLGSPWDKGQIHDDLKGKPERFPLSKPVGFAIYGGGQAATLFCLLLSALLVTALVVAKAVLR